MWKSRYNKERAQHDAGRLLHVIDGPAHHNVAVSARPLEVDVLRQIEELLLLLFKRGELATQRNDERLRLDRIERKNKNK